MKDRIVKIIVSIKVEGRDAETTYSSYGALATAEATSEGRGFTNKEIQSKVKEMVVSTQSEFKERLASLPDEKTK